jgi:hypothetical protein
MAKTYKNPGKIEFDAVVTQSDTTGSTAFVPFPFDLKELFGYGNLIPVRVLFDSTPYRGSLAKMGHADGHAVIAFCKAERDKAGKKPGDLVHISVELDTDERTVEIPSDLQTALEATPAAQSTFESLAFTHQREYVRWVNEAKRAETRVARVQKTVAMLLEGKKARSA